MLGQFQYFTGLLTFFYSDTDVFLGKPHLQVICYDATHK